MTDDIRELTEEDFARSIPRRQRERTIRGQISEAKTSPPFENSSVSRSSSSPTHWASVFTHCAIGSRVAGFQRDRLWHYYASPLGTRVCYTRISLLRPEISAPGLSAQVPVR